MTDVERRAKAKQDHDMIGYIEAAMRRYIHHHGHNHGDIGEGLMVAGFGAA